MIKAQILCKSTDPQWLTLRHAGVTATDIGAILGCSPYESEYSLHFKKRGLLLDYSEDNDRLRLGRELQPYVLKRWAEETEGPLWSHDTLWQSTERLWQMATVDALTTGSRPVEAKTWADADRWRWKNGPPLRIRTQALWQADVFGLRAADVAVLFLPSGAFERHIVTFDPGEQERMRDAAWKFRENVESENPPPVDGSYASIHALKYMYPEPTVRMAEVTPEIWDEFVAARLSGYEARLRAGYAEAVLRDEIGDARKIMCRGEHVGTRVSGERDYLKVRNLKGD